MLRLSRLAVLLLGLAAAGCATRADLMKVQRELRETRALVADTQVALDNVKRRIDSVSANLEEEVRRSDGRRSPMVASLERRVANLEAQLATGQAGVEPVDVPAVQPETAGPGQRTEAAPIALRADESLLRAGSVDGTYRAAMDLYKQGRCDQAIAKFREFVRTSAKSEVAGNAQYWIGECYYSQRDFNRAIIELNEVLLKYPKSNRVPGALLALATAFADSGDKIDARLILQKLISDHPRSEEAEVGRQKLQALTQ